MGKGLAWGGFALSCVLFAASLARVVSESRHRAMMRQLEAEFAERVPVVAIDPAPGHDDRDDGDPRLATSR